MVLYGELLEPPTLRFNFSSVGARDAGARRGLVRYGPYDSSLFPYEQIRAAVVFPKGCERQRDLLVKGIRDGEETFRGFQSLFRVPLAFDDEEGIPFSTDSELQTRLDGLVAQANPPDIVYVILPRQRPGLYVKAKSRLLANGIPSQMAIAEKLTEQRGRQYTLENLALATYAKVGGTPWTVAASDAGEELVLGVSRAQDASRKYLVGYVILFTKDGDFLFVNSKAPVFEWDAYVDGLSGLVHDAVVEFERMRGTPECITVHFHRNPGWKELEAVKAGLERASKEIPFALLHLNDDSNFRLFDAQHGSYVPRSGLKVTLSAHEALLMLDGRRNGERRKIGVPTVLDVRMDSRSTLGEEHFPRLVKQVSDFAHINWRGFNAAAVPITLNYSKLIAKMIAEISVQAWNATVAEGRLKDKAWFL